MSNPIETQDPWWMSKRVYASVAAVVALLLSWFGLEVDRASLIEIVAAAAGLAAAILPLWSKRRDPREVKRK